MTYPYPFKRIFAVYYIMHKTKIINHNNASIYHKNSYYKVFLFAEQKCFTVIKKHFIRHSVSKIKNLDTHPLEQQTCLQNTNRIGKLLIELPVIPIIIIMIVHKLK